MNDPGRPENDRVAFCQNCGKPLSAEDARNVGSAVFCEPCLVAKVAAAETPRAAGAGASQSGSYGFSGTSSGVNYNFQGAMPPPPSGGPNPGLAALLGFIPGVGAFYNGQYAKGVVHLVVFAILTSLADHGNSIFGLLVMGWVFYQVIEAHHTARARRDGTPLPNPFGLNDIGERLGFGRAWPGASPAAAQGAPAYPPPASAPSSAEPAASGSYVPPASAYAPHQGDDPGYVPPPAPSWGAPYESYGAVPPHDSSFPQAPGAGNRVPTGAILLIGLGVLFLIGNSGFFHSFPVHRLIPFLLIGVGVWLFVRKMTETGGSWIDDGTPSYRLRLFRAARGPVWIVLVGVLFLLDSFNILSWGRSWPLFIIVGGLMTFFERTAYSASTPLPYPYVPPSAPPAPGPSAPVSATIVPTNSQTGSDDREGI